jgi:single-strand DNA-binding protein
MLIGNLTRDPNLRYTPNNTAVCSFGLATNRAWTTDNGEREERTDFHNIVSWAKLAEICDEILQKGDKVYVEGRLQTRDWKTDDGPDRRVTEVVIDNMIKLASPHGRSNNNSGSKDDYEEETPVEEPGEDEVDTEEVADDIPF